MSFITNEVRSIMSKAIDRYSKNYGLDNTEMQILIMMKGADDVTYFVMRKYVTEQEITFMDLLGVKIDFKMYSQIAPQFIRRSMERMCTDYGVDGSKLSVMIVKNAHNEIKMFSYNGKELIGEVTFDYLFMEN